MNQQGIKKVARAVQAVCLDMPFYSGMLLKIDVRPDEDIPTFATDGRSILFNSDFAAVLTAYGNKFVIIHELWHIMLKHHLRKGARTHQKYNRAGDFVIHGMMHEDKMKILDWVLFDEKFIGMTTEQVYNLLPDDPQDDQCNGKGGAGTVSNDAPNIPGGCSIGEVVPMKKEDGTAMSDADKAQVSQEIDVAIAQAVNQARSAGTMTGAQERFVKELLEPKVYWQDVLRQYFEQFARDDYNWAMPNRRYTSFGLYLPSLKSETMPDIVVYIDTSGSVSSDELNMFMSEIANMLTTFKVVIHVVYVDSEFAGHQEFRSDEFWNISEFEPKGFGGTDFRPGFEWVEEQGITPAVAIYFTDLDCSRFPKEPDYPVIWAVNNPYNYKRDLPFGCMIQIEKEWD